MSRNKTSYTKEFKQKCIKALLDGGSFSEVCRNNNLPASTLSDWRREILFGFSYEKEKEALEKDIEEYKAMLAEANEIIKLKDLEIGKLKKEQKF